MDLAVKTREIIGKKVRALRREGMVPAELYGHGIENVHLAVSAKEFNKVYKEAGQTGVITLLVGKEKRPAMIHEIMRDSVTGDFLHVDFHQIRMDEKITAKVPLVFAGEAPAVKEKGAILNKAILEIEVEALPASMPHEITVDLASLKELNESIYVKDIKRPHGVKFLVEDTAAVVTATEPKAEEEAPAPAMDVTDIKVETEEKKAERQAEKAKEGPTDKAEAK
ncbi:MAG TPA: 50S ribosomal protein L25 [Candidatus Paceibacterota bacterium]|nr:50S ribosomal protein L25 [Candidatus Paceibacterota bacterium]